MSQVFDAKDSELLKRKYGLNEAAEKSPSSPTVSSCSCQSSVTKASTDPFSLPKLPILPGDGIGPLKLGMKRSEMEAQLELLCHQLGHREALHTGGKELHPHRSCYLLRYFVGSSFFLVDYNEQHQAISISVHQDTSTMAGITLYGQPVFSMEAADLMAFLQEKDDCVFDADDALLCGQFTCPHLGLRLWRDFGPSQEQLADPQWKEKLDEDESFLITFPLITVFNPDYGKELCYI